MNHINLSAHTVWVIAGMVAALVTGSLVRISSLHATAPDIATSRLQSLRSWWLVAAVVVGISLIGVVAACVVFSIVGVLALTEFLRLAGTTSSARVRYVTFGLVPAAYLLIGFEATHAFQVVFPIAALLLVSVTMVCEQRTTGFVNDVARHVWGLLATTYLPGHAVLLFYPPIGDARSGAALFLLLIILTEANDITQALIGRRFGRRKLIPRVSPNKTWEGFLGGAACTILLSGLIGPWLTPLHPWQAVLAGLLVAVAGLFGDLTISAVKRDAGVKDSGTLLPGQGGILDRIDSLILTAPTFYFFVTVLVP